MNVEEIFQDGTRRMKSTIEHTRHEFTQIRTGRASPALMDGIKVAYYGTPTPLKSLANVTAPDSRLLVVQPYDKNLIHDIEKSIQAADLGLNPSTDGNVIRVPIPPLTEERRKELVKLVHKFIEDGRIAIRNVRKDINNHLRNMEKSHELSKDEEMSAFDRIQKLTDKFIAEIDQLQVLKEKEILEG